MRTKFSRALQTPHTISSSVRHALQSEIVLFQRNIVRNVGKYFFFFYHFTRFIEKPLPRRHVASAHYFHAFRAVLRCSSIASVISYYLKQVGLFMPVRLSRVKKV